MNRLIDFALLRKARALDAYWDAVVHGSPESRLPRSAEAAELGTMIRYLHGVADAGQTAEATRTAAAGDDPILDELLDHHRQMQALHREETTMSPTAVWAPARPAPWPGAPARRKGTRAQAWPRSRSGAALTAAAVVLLVLGLAFGPLGLWPRADESRTIPAVVVQEAASPAASVEQTLVEFTFPQDIVPERGRTEIGFRLFAVAANAESSWSGSSGELAPGLWGDYILAGTLTMTSAGPVEVVRAGGDGTLETVPDGTPVELAPGDTILHRTQYDTTWTIGSDAVQILSWIVIGPTWATYPQPGGWEEVSFDLGQDTLDPGSNHVRVWRATIKPDGQVPGPDVGTQRGVVLPQGGAFIRKGADDTIRLGGAEGPTTVHLLTITPSVEFLWQSSGNPDDPMENATNLAIAPDGAIWVPDGRNARFQIFSPEGELLEVWGSEGTGEGQFDFLIGGNAFGGYGRGAIAFAPDGSFYVADTANHRIQKFGPDRAFITAWGSEGTGDGQFAGASDLAVDSQGRVYVVDANRGLASSPADAVQVFDADGRFLASWGAQGLEPGQLDFPVGITIDRDGTILIAAYNNQRVQRFTPEGEHLGSLGEVGVGESEGQINGAFDVAVDAEGHIFEVDYNSNRVQVFDRDGRFLLAWGGTGTGDGLFWGAVAVAVDGEGNVYVADDSGRVQKFRVKL